MSAQTDGGPAFPNITPDMIVVGGPGMSLRDWFAGQAIASGKLSDRMSAEILAVYAYELADAMLAERERVRP